MRDHSQPSRNTLVVLGIFLGSIVGAWLGDFLRPVFGTTNLINGIPYSTLIVGTCCGVLGGCVAAVVSSWQEEQ
jgi:uncharacterized membrane protein YeaQ/YmgE (transglycosylase-associated protein family)